MIRDLDNTLEAILTNQEAPEALRNANVSFETPDRNYNPDQATVNLFLYEIKENRDLRDPEPITEKIGDIYISRHPPLRLDCAYMVTTWSTLVRSEKVAEEHRLLSQALLWMSRFPTIPAGFLRGSLIDQPYPPPTMVAQIEPNKNVGEFWSALGTPPRPLFYLIVTIALDLGIRMPEGPPVATKEFRIKQKMPEGVAEPILTTLLKIGGTINNANTLVPIAGARVIILELEWETTTDENGHYSFSKLEPRDYTLRVVANGYTTMDHPITVPAQTPGAYNVGLLS